MSKLSKIKEAVLDYVYVVVLCLLFGFGLQDTAYHCWGSGLIAVGGFMGLLVLGVQLMQAFKQILLSPIMRYNKGEKDDNGQGVG